MGGETWGKGGDPNRTGIMYWYENTSRFGNQRGTLTISSGFVAGVSRRMAAGVGGGRREREKVGRKISETNGLQAERIRERKKMCAAGFIRKEGSGEKGEGFFSSRSIQSRRDGRKKRGERDRERGAGKHRQVREENIQNMR